MNTGMNTYRKPYLSCIVATYNAQKTLPVLLESLKKQDLQNVEIIIQDGGSQDRTLDILEEWRHSFPQLKIYTDPDTGIYDAWNKALAHIEGQWVIFLGADDTWLSEDSISQAISFLKGLPENAIYMATPVVVVPHAEETPNASRGSLLCPLAPVEQYLPQGMSLPHQGLFHHASLFQQYHFDTSFRIAGDYDFLARTYTLGTIFTNHTPFVCMAAGGISSALDSMWRCEWEQLQISRRHFPKAIPWKLTLRLVRSLICAGLIHTLGMGTAARFANGIRKILGRPPLWDIPR